MTAAAELPKAVGYMANVDGRAVPYMRYADETMAFVARPGDDLFTATELREFAERQTAELRAELEALRGAAESVRSAAWAVFDNPSQSGSRAFALQVAIANYDKVRK